MTSTENDVLSIRVRGDIKQLFYELSKRNQMTQNEMFTKLLQQYQAGKDGKRKAAVRRVHGVQ